MLLILSPLRANRTPIFPFTPWRLLFRTIRMVCKTTITRFVASFSKCLHSWVKITTALGNTKCQFLSPCLSLFWQITLHKSFPIYGSFHGNITVPWKCRSIDSLQLLERSLLSLTLRVPRDRFGHWLNTISLDPNGLDFLVVLTDKRFVVVLVSSVSSLLRRVLILRRWFVSMLCFD